MDIRDVIQDLAAHTTDAIVIAEAEQRTWPGPTVLWCNRAFSDMTGYAPEEIIGKTPRILQGPDTDPATRQRIADGLRRWRTIRAQLLNYRKNGEPFWVDLNIKPVADETGWYRFWVAVQRDITADREKSLRLEAANKLLRNQGLILEHSKDVAMMTDAAGRIEWVNPAFTRLTGYTLDEVRGSKPGPLLQGPDTAPATVEQIRRAIAASEPIDIEILNHAKNGAPYWIDLSIVPVIENGKAVSFIATQRDVTLRREQEHQLQAFAERTALQKTQVEAQNSALKAMGRQIEHNTRHDPVTGLPNRAWLAWAYADPAAPVGGAPAVVDTFGVIDIDDFFLVNDAFGHGIGDRVLMSVADRLRATAGDEAIVVRLSGDEFAVLGRFGPTDESRLSAMERFKAELRKPFTIEGHPIRLAVTVGLAHVNAPNDVFTAERHADAALRHAKRSRIRLAVYSDQVAKGVEALRWFVAEFPRAIEQNEFVPFFQLQVDAQTWAPTGVETLARWHHPELGPLAPAEFLAAAAILRSTNKIDDMTASSAVAAFEQWQRAGYAPAKMSINIRAARLLEPAYLTWLQRLQGRIGGLSVELLETSIEDELHDSLLPALVTLRQSKIGIEIDDFGTGHASIMSLIRLKPDRIKIDRSMVPRTMADDEKMEALSAVIILARTGGARVTTEGIETAEQARIMAQLGADQLQGYFFARPAPAAEVAKMLNRSCLPWARKSEGSVLL